MKTPQGLVFTCEYPHEYLSLLFQKKRELRPRYSMQQFGHLIGVLDSGSLSRIMNGKRALSLSVARKIVLGLKLKPEEELYFYQMVLLQEAIDQVRVPLLQSLKSILAKVSLQEASGNEDQFAAIANCQYLAVRECLRLKNKTDLATIWRAGPLPDFDKIFETLRSLDLVSDSANGYRLEDERPFVFASEKKNEAIRHYHSSWLDVASYALNEVPTSERHFMGTTLAIPSWAYDEVVRRINHLHHDILELSMAEGADQVIHFGSFVLPVTAQPEQTEERNI